MLQFVNDRYPLHRERYALHLPVVYGSSRGAASLRMCPLQEWSRAASAVREDPLGHVCSVWTHGRVWYRYLVYCGVDVWEVLVLTGVWPRDPAPPAPSQHHRILTLAGSSGGGHALPQAGHYPKDHLRAPAILPCRACWRRARLARVRHVRAAAASCARWAAPPVCGPPGAGGRGAGGPARGRDRGPPRAAGEIVGSRRHWKQCGRSGCAGAGDLRAQALRASVRAIVVVQRRGLRRRGSYLGRILRFEVVAEPFV